MKRWRSKDIQALAESNAARVAEAYERASRDSHGGLPSGHGDGRTTLNKDGTPHSRTVRWAEQGVITRDTVLLKLRAMEAAISHTAELIEWLCGMGSEQAQQSQVRPGAGWCENRVCDRWCTGGGEDRLKAGRCSRCYQHRLRHGGDDWRPDAGITENGSH